MMWHDVVRALFPGLPSDLSGSSYLTSEEELIAAGLGPYLKKCLTVIKFTKSYFAGCIQ